MTSKEALKEIKQAPTFMGGNPRYMYSTQSSEPFLEDIKVIEKDLEVLEILKDKKVNIPYLHSLFEQEDDETIVWYYNLGLEEEEPRMKKITIDDFYKIKEWLENEIY